MDGSRWNTGAGVKRKLRELRPQPTEPTTAINGASNLNERPGTIPAEPNDLFNFVINCSTYEEKKSFEKTRQKRTVKKEKFEHPMLERLRKIQEMFPEDDLPTGIKKPCKKDSSGEENEESSSAAPSVDITYEYLCQLSRCEICGITLKSGQRLDHVKRHTIKDKPLYYPRTYKSTIKLEEHKYKLQPSLIVPQAVIAPPNYVLCMVDDSIRLEQVQQVGEVSFQNGAMSYSHFVNSDVPEESPPEISDNLSENYEAGEAVKEGCGEIGETVIDVDCTSQGYTYECEGENEVKDDLEDDMVGACIKPFELSFAEMMSD